MLPFVINKNNGYLGSKFIPYTPQHFTNTSKHTYTRTEWLGTCSQRLASQTNILTECTKATDTNNVQRLSQSAHTRNNFKPNSLQTDSHTRAFFSQLISISQTENYMELNSIFFFCWEKCVGEMQRMDF